MTPKQARFVQEYLIDLNATQAAIRAGYSERTAQEQGSRLLSNVMVSRAIAEGQAKYAKRAEMDADEWRARVARLARFDVRKLFDSETNKLVPVTELADDVAPCVSGVKVLREKTTRVRGQDTETDIEETLVEVKTADVLRALEMTGKHLGLLTDRVELSGRVDLAAHITAARKRLNGKG